MEVSILLTGATGFLGSYVAETLVNNKVKIIALKRKDSDLWRCESFTEKIKWVEIDGDGVWKKDIAELKPTCIIHCAWIGVGADERDDLGIQIKNISFLADLLEIAKESKCSKFIGLGSQAEYGYLDNSVSEDKKTDPLGLYGAVKVASQKIVKTFCELNEINWIWLRLFSFIGERENENWLVPSLIKKLLKGESIDMSPGNQEYSYMDADDFSKIMLQIVNKKISPGIYNVSAHKTVSLKELVSLISHELNVESKINWGALQYRHNQSMVLQGNMDKLTAQLGDNTFLNINETISKLVSNNNKTK